MRAWRVHSLGDPSEVMSLDEVDQPTPGPGQVLVQVRAAALNFPDVLMAMGTYQEKPPLPFTPGVELCGEIVETGQRVLGSPSGGPGAFAEYALMDAAAAFPVPEGMPDEKAASLYLTYQTGYVGLHRRAHLQPGEVLLVHAGAGGVGSAAIQLARKAGVRVLATAGGPEKCAWLRAQGVEVAIDHQRDDVAAQVAAATSGRGVDVVLDPIGGRELARSQAMCAPLGRVVMYGVSAMSPGKRRSVRALVREGLPMRFFNLVPLFERNVGVHGINMLKLALAEPARMQAVMAEILADIAAGAYAPVIAARFGLDARGARAAHELLQDRRNIGKVLLVRRA